MNGNDIELLRRCVFERSEAAFAELVRQHIALAYSAALRHTSGDAHLAEDVTREVFTDLARKAPRLTRRTAGVREAEACPGSTAGLTERSCPFLPEIVRGQESTWAS
jgi:hypothetical protein